MRFPIFPGFPETAVRLYVCLCQRVNSWNIWDIITKILREQHMLNSLDGIRKWLHSDACNYGSYVRWVLWCKSFYAPLVTAFVISLDWPFSYNQASSIDSFNSFFFIRIILVKLLKYFSFPCIILCYQLTWWNSCLQILLKKKQNVLSVITSIILHNWKK